MEIFKALANIKDVEVTTSVVKENVYPEINGTVIITKGIVSFEVSYYGRLSEMYKMENFINMDDIEIEIEKTTINGLDIDDFHKFKQGLIDHGMKSVADSLTIDDSVIIEHIYKTIPKHKHYKSLFGKKQFIKLMSLEEQKLAYLDAMRKDITFMEGHNNLKSKFGWTNEEGTILTNEQILEIYK